MILVAISLIIYAVGYIYFGRVSALNSAKPAPPTPIRDNLSATADGWHFRQISGNHVTAEISAKKYELIKEPSTARLEEVELRIYHKQGDQFDLVKCAKADFDTADGILFSEGAVEITMAIPKDGEATNGRLVKIETSGVRLESKTGRATTDRLATFGFDRGNGKAMGAEYDPNTRQLHMKSAIELNWRGKDGKSIPMKVETGDLTYRESEAKIYLSPWSRLTRQNMKMDAGAAVVTLDDQVISLVEAQTAKGVQDDPGRKIEYAADQLTMHFSGDSQVTQINADKNAHLVSTAETAKTTVSSNHIDLDFDALDHESVLKRAVATGGGVVESVPVPKVGVLQAETRILRSERIQLAMRAGGKEIDNVETPAGTLEFVPNRPGVPHRYLNGDHIWIAYGPQNQIQSFRSVNVSTRTENPPKGTPPKPSEPALTWSKDMVAQFDPKTAQVTQIEQSTNFRYQEGDRKAKSVKAVLNQTSDVITLTGGARVWDTTGSTAADQIVMNQKNGDMSADGNVTSTRLPDKKGQSSAMLSNEEPTQAKARKMVSTDKNLKILYEGDAVLWQGSNRVQADRIDIDRDESSLLAKGNVISQFVDKPKEEKDKDGKAKPKTTAATPKSAIFTIVRAPELLYTDEDRIALYKGGVVLNRPDMNVKSKELRAYLNDSSADSSLDRAFADGAVEILQNRNQRTRTGTSEHAEYYTKDQKVILTGGQPQMVDSLKGNTKGKQLTYFANDDRLLVNGVAEQRATSTIHRK